MNLPPPIMIRPFRTDDAAVCLDLFRDSIHRVCHVDYSPDQLHAWASNQIDVQTWTRRFDSRVSFVALCDDSIVGFTDMTADGYLDRLFVSADHQRKGIARRLVQPLIDHATVACLDRITTQSSITARPFFESLGFHVTECQSVECRGVLLDNFRMELRLARTLIERNERPSA